jgi:hypothetical protein
MDASLLYKMLTYNLFFVSLSLHSIDSWQTDEKLHTELQSGMTLEAKKIDASETMNNYVKSPQRRIWKRMHHIKNKRIQ